MKIRNGFVSNSSSSSFIIPGVIDEFDQNVVNTINNIDEYLDYVISNHCTFLNDWVFDYISDWKTSNYEQYLQYCIPFLYEQDLIEIDVNIINKEIQLLNKFGKIKVVSVNHFNNEKIEALLNTKDSIQIY